MTQPKKSLGRRAWFVELARYGALTGIGLLVAQLLGRSDVACVQAALPCQECGLLERCRLPRAAESRQHVQPPRRRHDD